MGGDGTSLPKTWDQKEGAAGGKLLVFTANLHPVVERKPLMDILKPTHPH